VTDSGELRAARARVAPADVLDRRWRRGGGAAGRAAHARLPTVAGRLGLALVLAPTSVAVSLSLCVFLRNRASRFEVASARTWPGRPSRCEPISGAARGSSFAFARTDRCLKQWMGIMIGSSTMD